jgi:hypothetical protein
MTYSRDFYRLSLGSPPDPLHISGEYLIGRRTELSSSRLDAAKKALPSISRGDREIQYRYKETPWMMTHVATLTLPHGTMAFFSNSSNKRDTVSDRRFSVP